MDTKLRTSFIPKKNLVLKNEGGGGRISVNLFLALAVIVLALMILLAGGTFLYKKLIQKNIAEEGIALEKAEKAFELPLILDIKRLDERINAAETLLEKHTVVSPVFEALEALTLKTVRFTEFNYTNSGAPSIQLTGEAKNYTSVALLSDSFATDKRIKNPVFSDLDLNDQGDVNFSVAATIDPGIMLFSKYASGSN